MLACKGLTVSYGSVTALHSVSLNVQEKEIVALLGANGAGKTTLLRTLSGLVKPEAGQISFGGRSTAYRRPGEYAWAWLTRPNGVGSSQV
jgi:branched-chain amino acid transport system ATP-binding protein